MILILLSLEENLKMHLSFFLNIKSMLIFMVRQKTIPVGWSFSTKISKEANVYHQSYRSQLRVRIVPKQYKNCETHSSHERLTFSNKDLEV